MTNRVKVRIELDPSCHTPEVVIRTDRKTELVERMVSAVERCAQSDEPPLLAYDGNAALFLPPGSIQRIYTELRKLMVSTGEGTYELRSSLQEMESTLDPRRFMRISRFEIINIEKVSGFDLSFSGTIQVTFDDGSSTWVARRYVRALEQRLEQLYGKGGQEDE